MANQKLWLLLIFSMFTMTCYQMLMNEKLSLIEIRPKNDRQIELLNRKKSKFMIDFWSPLTLHISPLKAAVGKSLAPKFIDFLSANGIEHKLIGDLAKKKPKYFAQTAAKEFDYERHYNDLSQIYKELKRLSEQYSDRLSVFSIGKSSEDRDLMAVELKSLSQQWRRIIFECGVHSREWISPAFCLWLINKLINDTNDDSLLNHFQFVIIPTLNPDGYLYTWTTDRYWRKNREYNNKNTSLLGVINWMCYGIDMNRNFETQGFCKIGASSSECDPQEYCGTTPFKSPETRALKQYLIPIKDTVLVYFSIHAFSQLWMYNYGYTKDPHKLSEIAVKAIAKSRGTQYTYGGIAETIYPASGSSIDWAYDSLGINYTFALELPDTGKYGFELPETEIKPVSEETWAGIEAMLKEMVPKVEMYMMSMESTSVSAEIYAFNWLSFLSIISIVLFPSLNL